MVQALSEIGRPASVALGFGDMGAAFRLGALVTVVNAAACVHAPKPEIADPEPPPASPASAPARASLAEPVPPAAESPAERSLGVVDRGIFADLDALLQLPAPAPGARLEARVDRRHAILVVYADGWPHKVYPLGGDSPLEVGGERLMLRPGDVSELAGRLAPDAVSELAPGQVAPPGDDDDDGIPDPLDVLIGARKTALDGANYDDAYFALRFPNGDPPRDRGACMDVVVRAVRNAGVDLQRAVFDDEAATSRYSVSRRDPNIDHRRVRNAIVYFERHWEAHATALDDRSDPLRPGDVVFLDTFPDRPGPDHVGIVDLARGEDGYPLVINLWTFGYRTQAMDLLSSVPVTHRFRFPSKKP